MKRVRRAGVGVGLALLAVLLSACGVGGAPKEPIELTILHTGQVSGEILPCG